MWASKVTEVSNFVSIIWEMTFLNPVQKNCAYESLILNNVFKVHKWNLKLKEIKVKLNTEWN